MDKQGIYDFLDEKKIKYEVDEHEAVMNMEELNNVDLKYPGRDAKNLFVRDDKKKNYYLITVYGDKRVDLKEFKEKHNTRRLSFGKPDDLKAKLGLEPGAVSPFGLLNNEEHDVFFYLDRQFTKQGGHDRHSPQRQHRHRMASSGRSRRPFRRSRHESERRGDLKRQ